MALGALLFELINNAVKHAFANGMKGTLTIGLTTSKNNYMLDFKDDGVGTGPNPHGFGTHNVTDLVRLMGGTITYSPKFSGRKLYRCRFGGWSLV